MLYCDSATGEPELNQNPSGARKKASIMTTTIPTRATFARLFVVLPTPLGSGYGGRGEGTVCRCGRRAVARHRFRRGGSHRSLGSGPLDLRNRYDRVTTAFCHRCCRRRVVDRCGYGSGYRFHASLLGWQTIRCCRGTLNRRGASDASSK